MFERLHVAIIKFLHVHIKQGSAVLPGHDPRLVKEIHGKMRNCGTLRKLWDLHGSKKSLRELVYNSTYVVAGLTHITALHCNKKLQQQCTMNIQDKYLLSHMLGD